MPANPPPWKPTADTRNLWPPAKELARLARYRRGYQLYKGLHKDLFEPTRDETAHGPYVVCNAARAISRVISDRMVLETPRAVVGGADEVTKALDAILEASNWGRLSLRSLRGWSYRGDLVYKAVVRPKSGSGPPSLLKRAVKKITGLGKGGDSEVVIVEVLPDRFFPEWDSEDSERLQSATLTWDIPAKIDDMGKTTEWYQREEKHTPGLIENRLYFLRKDESSVGGRYRREEVTLASVDQFKRVPQKVDTGIEEIPLVHVPNNEIGEDAPWGASDFAEDTGFETNQRTLNERATDHRHMLRKWADPLIGVSSSFLVDTGSGKRVFDAYGHKALPIEPGEDPPKFVDVPLQNYAHSDAEADNALQRILWTVGISPESLGIYQTGYPESGAAIRLRQADTLNTVARKWTTFEPGLKRILSIAAQLANKHAGGPEAPPPEEITIERGDGIVQPEKERLEEIVMVQGLGFSDEHIIRQTYPDWDDEAVAEELARRKAERPDFGFGSRASPENAEPQIEDRAAELRGEETAEEEVF